VKWFGDAYSFSNTMPCAVDNGIASMETNLRRETVALLLRFAFAVMLNVLTTSLLKSGTTLANALVTAL
jgi:hypothetical protein